MYKQKKNIVVYIIEMRSTNMNFTVTMWGTRWRSWLRHCATSRKVAGSIPDGITGIFH
jgi:hypothetical protein